MFGPVQGQHARPDHPGGGEPRVVDGEGRAVAQYPQRQIPPGHQPSVERGKPGNGLLLAQPGQQRMRIALKIGQGHGLAEWEGAAAAAGSAGRRSGMPGTLPTLAQPRPAGPAGLAQRPPRPVAALITGPHPA